MAKEHSFDIVSKVNLQEVRNAVQMAQKEIGTRFDFRGSRASVDFDQEAPALKLTGDHQAQMNSVRDVVTGKLAKRGVPLQAFVWQEPELLPSGGVKQAAKLEQGLTGDKAKRVTKAIKEMKLKVQARIEGDTVRVAAKQIDDLQSVVQSLKSKDFGMPIQVENYR